MTELEFRTEPRVSLLCWMGGDEVTAQRARVSTGAVGKGYEGLVKRLATDRHGTPFEHSVFTFDIETSIMVARESHRHRVASISEASLRYMEGEPVVYVPGIERDLVQKPGSKQMDYETEPGSEDQRQTVMDAYWGVCRDAWATYQGMLAVGILREVARGVLPLCFGTRWHLTINARSLMNFLSLRVEDPLADRVSHPQYEIEQVALRMEAIFAQRMPVTYRAFIDNGRRTP